MLLIICILITDGASEIVVKMADHTRYSSEFQRKLSCIRFLIDQLQTLKTSLLCCDRINLSNCSHNAHSVQAFIY